MPALRMKKKLRRGFVELHNYHIPQKSIRRSENLSAQINTEVDPIDQSYQNVVGKLSKETATSTGNSLCDSRITDSDGTSTIFLNMSSLSPDLLPVETMASICWSETSGSPSTMLLPEQEMTFSPNFEDGGPQLKLSNHCNGVKCGNHELPNLVADEDDGNNGLSDYQACSLLELYLDTFPSFPVDSSMGFADVSFQNYELINSGRLIDVVEKYVTLPFLDNAIESSGIPNNESTREIMSSDDACLFLATHQEFDLNCFSGDFGKIDCFNPQLDFRSFHDIWAVPSNFPTLLPKDETQERKPITLVLDLDETLVHSTLEECDDADFTFSVFSNMEEQTVYVRRRPFLQIFLERVAQMFEIVIFTASLSIYATQLLDILDPDQKIISRRVFRESCLFSDGCYTKDLNILGVDLAKVAIIDNTPQVFQLQVNNGIPIKSWFDDPSDCALVQLLPFLETLVDAEDVRPIIANKFGNEV
ncbi:uncharacterized protein LOC121975602 [Zingiber officinale]|uniref:uncharacterized protein LOC121975602 n=1 Tax=Zingiber officinale TaxID=94328 RepID=UPI001C4C5C16|nr:uncharacterized protein LOC121975602 [Zingiber officinale]